MLETLTLDADATLLVEPDISIDGILFEEGKLWKARYPSLVKYEMVPAGYRVEPAIQITDLEKTQLTVRLALAAGFIFQTEGTGVKFQWVDGQSSPPPDCISAVLEGPGACLVTWTRDSSSPSTIALRFFCRPETGPIPDDPESVNEGGVYLAFVVREEVWPEEVIKYLREHPPAEPSQPLSQDGGDVMEVMKVVALLLKEGHVRYNLFKSGAPAGTEFELAFRLRRSTPPKVSKLSFEVEIANLGFSYQPDPENPGMVVHEITYPAVWLHPLELVTQFGAHQKSCQVTWTSVHPYQEHGLSSSFNLIAKLDERGSAFRPVDPTVIEPPSCSGGICIG